MSKILANQIANYADNSPIELKEGLNIPAGKELQAGGTFGTLGQVLSSTGTTIQWTNPFSGNYQDLTNKPTIPAAQVQSDWNATSGIEVIKNKPSIPGVPSVTVASASGGGNLSYNGGNGEFTYTPPDLSNFLTSLGAAAGVTTQKITNWDNAFGWGDHSTEGYLTSVPALALSGLSNVSSTAPSNGQVLKWNNANSEWEPGTDLTSSGGSGIALTDLSTSTGAASGGGSLAYNNGTGVFTFAPADLTSFITSETDTLQSVITRGAVVNSGSPTFNVSVSFDADINVNQNIEMVDDKIIKMGTDDDLQIAYTNGSSASTITDTSANGLTISSTDIGLNSGATKFVRANATNTIIYHNDDPRITTTATGITVAGSVTASGGNSTNWNTAYGWGDHGAGGYLTSLGDAIVDGDFTSNGFMKRTGAGTYTVDTSTYLTDIVSDTSPVLGGNLDLNGKTIFGNGGGVTKTSISDTEGFFPGGFGIFAGAASIGWKFFSDGRAICRADGPNSDGTSINALQIGNFSDLSCLTIDGTGAIVTDATVTATSGFSGDLTGNATTAGDLAINASARLLYQAANNDTDIMNAGSAGQVLTSQGDGIVPSWTTLDKIEEGTTFVEAYENGGGTGKITFDVEGTEHVAIDTNGQILISGTQTGNNVAKIYNDTDGAGTGVLGIYASSDNATPRDVRIYSGGGTANEIFRAGKNGQIGVNSGDVGTAGQVLTSGGASATATWTTVSTTGLSSRQTYTATTISIADGASDTIDVGGYKSYALLAIEPSAAAWVTVYTDATARSADSGRSENTDPLPGSGVIAEVITTSANQKQIITPGTIGWNNDGTPSTNMYLKVVNKSGSNAAITVGMTVIQLEA